MKRYLIFAALGPFIGGFFLLIATTVMSGSAQPLGSGEAVRGVSQDASIQLSVRHPAGTDDRRGRRHFLPCQTNKSGGPNARRRRDRVSRGGVSLWLAGGGLGRHPVHPVRPGRLHAGNDLVLARA